MRFSGDPAVRGALTACVAALLLALASGCGCSPGVDPVAFHITLDNSMRDSTGTFRAADIDIIGMNLTDKDRLSKATPNTYFAPDSPLRQSNSSDRVSIKLSDQAKAQTIPANDPHWARWLQKGAQDMMIIAYFRGAPDDGKLVIPLNRCQWNGAKVIEIEVAADGVHCRTSILPEKK